jgi:hypothetical protein
MESWKSCRPHRVRVEARPDKMRQRRKFVRELDPEQLGGVVIIGRRAIPYFDSLLTAELLRTEPQLGRPEIRPAANARASSRTKETSSGRPLLGEYLLSPFVEGLRIGHSVGSPPPTQRLQVTQLGTGGLAKDQDEDYVAQALQMKSIGDLRRWFPRFQMGLYSFDLRLKNQ